MIVPAFKKDLQKDYNFLEHECVTERIYWVLPLIILNCHKIVIQFLSTKKALNAENSC